MAVDVHSTDGTIHRELWPSAERGETGTLVKLNNLKVYTCVCSKMSLLGETVAVIIRNVVLSDLVTTLASPNHCAANWS